MTALHDRNSTPKTGPVLVPNKACDWTLLYDPNANNGHRSIKLTLGDESVTFDLRPQRERQRSDEQSEAGSDEQTRRVDGLRRRVASRDWIFGRYRHRCIPLN